MISDSAVAIETNTHIRNERDGFENVVPTQYVMWRNTRRPQDPVA